MSLQIRPINMFPKGWVPTTLEEDNNELGLIGIKNDLAIKLSDLTTSSLDGTGVFDILMRTTKQHLQREYQANRITGAEYAEVYLGALTAVLQNATQFLLNEQQVERLNVEIALTRQQIVSELANTDDSVPVGLGFNHIPDERTAITTEDCWKTPVI